MKQLLCIFGHKLSPIMINGDAHCLRCDKWMRASECSSREIADAQRRAELEYPPMSYANNTIPKDYKCHHCGAQGCKLWREYQTCDPELLCCDCAVKKEKKDFVIEEDGMYDGKYGRSDQIGWYVPAVPTEDGIGYWGYTSVSDAGVAYWKRLPLRIKK